MDTKIFLGVLALLVFAACTTGHASYENPDALIAKFVTSPEGKMCDIGVNKCYNDILFSCTDNKFAKNVTCPFKCERGRCIECYSWRDSEGFNIYEGSRNKCQGNDVHKCVNGHWEFVVTCPEGCVEDPVLTRSPSLKPEAKTNERNTIEGSWRRYLPIRNQNGTIVTEGHCKCTRESSNLHIGDWEYQCLGYKDKYYYTKLTPPQDEEEGIMKDNR
jgi:hypothetical protein